MSALPTGFQDQPIRKLAAYLKSYLNDAGNDIWDGASSPREDVVRVAVPYRPDMLTTKTFPLLSCYRTSWNTGTETWSAECRWQLSASTKAIEDQQDYLYWVAKTLRDALESYPESGDACMGDIAAITITMGFITLVQGNQSTGLSFPTLQASFTFTDLDG